MGRFIRLPFPPSPPPCARGGKRFSFSLEDYARMAIDLSFCHIVSYYMHAGYRLFLSFFLFFFTVSNAYPFTMSRFFDSNGNPAVSPRARSGGTSSQAIAGYAVPEGIELRKDITYEFYPVFGRSYSRIVRSAAENAPFVRGRNLRSTSRTVWGLGISYQYDYTYDVDKEHHTVQAVIDISDISIKYNITVTLPALLDDSSLNAVEKQLWKNYFRRLLEHEHGKVEIIQYVDTKKKVEDDVGEIKGLSFDYTNDSDVEHSVEVFLGEETDKIGREWIKKIKEKLAAYDQKPAGGEVPEPGKSSAK
jgi:hypothetical protein